MEELIRYMRAMVLLQLAGQLGNQYEKPEFVLARAGFKAKEISELLGKTEAAVAKAISRAKNAPKSRGESSDE